MLRLLVIRHGLAGNREDFALSSGGQDDSLRPLTRVGRKRMEVAARGLRRAAGTLDVVATSPLVRAAQTARIVAAACGGEITTAEALLPTATPAEFLRWLLHAAPSDGTLAAVGHEPHLGVLTTWLMTSTTRSRVAYRKGGAALLEFRNRPRRGSATLLWALTPRLARALV